ncbi:MAG: pantetheine-phosphate adenylyltransferase, partial [Solirubrobacterales bacterium]|nr:pantetheine-phosphate adenylyltransferase [Solirubrobacterales bacterium]
MIARSSKMYDHVIVAVVNLPWRKGSTVFSTEERVGFLTGATREIANVSVEPFSTLLVDFARQRGAM